MQLSNAKEIVLNQNTEWTRMMSEESERQNLLRYGMLLITIAYAILFVLSLVFAGAISAFAPYSLMYLISSVIIRYALTIASLYFVPQILAAIAPSFGGKNDAMNALKLYVFAATPAWIGTAFGIIPVLGWLVALAGGVYAIFLFWQHFADALSIPSDKKIGYVLVSVVVLAVIFFVIGAVGSGIANMVSPVSVFHTGPSF